MSAAANVGPESGLGFAPAPTLLRWRLRMAVNGALHAGPQRRGWTVVLGAGAVGITVLGYRVARAAFLLALPEPDRVDSVVTGALGMVAGFTAVTAITFALSSLYFARDLDALLAAPLPPRSILLTRLCVQLGTGVAIGAVLVAPALLGYMVTVGHAQLLPLVGLAVVAMAAMPLAAGTALTIAAVRVLPARRVREAGGLLVTAVLVIVTGVNLAVRGPDAFSSGGSGVLDPTQRYGAAGSAWLPTGWASHCITAALRGEALTAGIWLLPLLVGGVASLLLVSALGERAFVTGFQRSQEAARGRSRRSATGPARRPLARLLAGRVWAGIALKDLREIRRDASQLGQLLLPIALFALYIAAPGGGHGPIQSGGRLPGWFGTSLTAGFASLFAASGIALRGVGTEGRRLWLLRSAPIDAWTVLRAKLAVGVAVAGALGLLLLWLGELRATESPLVVGLATVRLLVVIAGLVGLATGMGAIRPRLDWTDPRRAVGVGLSLAFLVLGAVYLAAAFVILGLPYVAPVPSTGALIAADAGVVALAAAVSAVALVAGVARLRKLEL